MRTYATVLRLVNIENSVSAMKSYRLYFLSLLSLATSLLLLVSGTGCSDVESGCRTDGDCRSGRVCIDRVCVDDPEFINNGNNDNNASDAGNNGNPQNNGDAGGENNINNGVDAGNDDAGTTDMGASDMGASDMGVDDMGDENDMPGEVDMGMQTDMTPPVLGPQIRVSPADRIDYGNVILQTTVDYDVIVENIGDADLIIDFANLAATPSMGFAVNPTIDSAMPLTLTPGDSTIFTVSFTPTVISTFANDFRVESNDTDDPQVEVELRGTGRSPIVRSCFYSAPDELDFGSVAPGSSVTRNITIGNCGTTQNVTVTSIEFQDMPGAPFSFTGPTLPLTLNAGQTDTVAVTYSPTGFAEVENRIDFRSDAQVGTTNEVDLEGDGGGCVEPLALGESQAEMSDSLRNGPVMVVLGDSITLDASETDSPTGSFVPDWSVSSAPSGSLSTIASTTSVTTSFAPDLPGEYTISLDASDTDRKSVV